MTLSQRYRAAASCRIFAGPTGVRRFRRERSTGPK
jgi:hypothetical protein